MLDYMVNVNGIDLHVAEEGQGDPVLFCHGFPDTWRGWRRQMAAVTKAGYRTIAPDKEDGLYSLFHKPLPELRESMPGLRGYLEIEDAGHWVTQEKPEILNAALLDFLRDLKAEGK